MTSSIPASTWSTILNVHYGACLSVIFALSLVANLTPPELDGKVIYFYSTDSAFVFFALVLYFFVDCIVANIRLSSYTGGIVNVLLALIWIWYLGYCVIISKSPQPEKYIALPVYILVARIYQTVWYSTNKNAVDGMMQVGGIMVSAIASILALIMLWQGALIYTSPQIVSDFSDALGHDRPVLTVLFAVILLFKIAEAGILAKTSQIRS